MKRNCTWHSKAEHHMTSNYMTLHGIKLSNITLLYTTSHHFTSHRTACPMKWRHIILHYTFIFATSSNPNSSYHSSNADNQITKCSSYAYTNILYGKYYYYRIYTWIALGFLKFFNFKYALTSDSMRNRNVTLQV